MASIILSVPHAVCRDENDKILHLCDVVAERVARRLFDLLTDKGYRVMLRIADINREEIDLNRPESRDTAFRRGLLQDFPKAFFLLDIHSFPKKEKWSEDVVLLKWARGSQDNREYVCNLLWEVAKTDLNVASVYGMEENDIVAHALENGLPAILVEFSEVSIADQGTSVVDRFAQAFVAFLQKLPKGVPEKKPVALPETRLAEGREDGIVGETSGERTMEKSGLKKAFGELFADRNYLELTPREKRFIENFLSTVTGDWFVDGANFQSDLQAYGYKNVTRLLAIYNRHYPSFAEIAKRSSKEKAGKPEKIPEGRAAIMGDLETELEYLLQDLGWKPSVNVDVTREGVRAELEDWVDHDPSVGIYGGREAYVIFDIDEDGMRTTWRWEPHVDQERRRETEAYLLKHERQILGHVFNILGM